MLACPFLILAIALAAFLGPSLGNAMIAIGITTTPIFMRLTRGQADERQGRGLCRSRARASAIRRWRIALFHILPNICRRCWCRPRFRSPPPSLPKRAVVPRPRAAAAGAVLGLHAEFGTAVPDQRAVDGAVAGPGDLPVVLSFNLVGDGLRDALDPRER